METWLIFLYAFNFLVTTIKRLPSGPWGLPIVGYYPFLKDESYLEFDSLSKKYGPVYSLKLGQHDVVVICDWNHHQLAFADESLLAKPHELFFEGLIKYPSFVRCLMNIGVLIDVQAEIADVIGFDREPVYTDRNRMPFTMAFLYEAQRIGSVIAVNLLRRVTYGP
uniref:Cytochrome P450 n=1 Tax=Tetranychus urticae TaxID=32264 RepID=T1L5I1_TETUR